MRAAESTMRLRCGARHADDESADCVSFESTIVDPLSQDGVRPNAVTEQNCAPSSRCRYR
jgi:hypothetical protein